MQPSACPFAPVPIATETHYIGSSAARHQSATNPDATRTPPGSRSAGTGMPAGPPDHSSRRAVYQYP